MPELPDVVVYVERLHDRLVGRPLERLRIASPFVLRSVAPPVDDVEGRTVTGTRRLGKRIVLALTDERFVIIHLMIAGRLRWRPQGSDIPKKRGLAALDFDHGTVLLTEEGSTKRASLHLARGRAALAGHDPGGLEVLDASLDEFRTAITRENHTLKRTLTSPQILSGIGNAYSDEILHRAGLSPLTWSSRLTAAETDRLFEATRRVLTDWTDRLRAEVGDAFPEKVTAFREGMAVHGRYGRPCPACGTAVQRISYAANEANYCPTCQTAGRLLADRGLSRLLRDDWPRTLEELEERKALSRAEGDSP